MRDIKILGGGISGLTAAINLAKAGFNVDVYEKRSDCGKRFNGDLEGLENWSSKIDIRDEFKLMSIKTNFDCNPFRTVNITNGREVLTETLEKPVFFIVKRGVEAKSLDQGLKKQALDLGINIHFNTTKGKENVNIISTGPSGNKPIGYVKGITFETDLDDIAVLLLNKKASSGGYSYYLVSNGQGCICSVNVIVSRNKAREYFQNTYNFFDKLFDLNVRNKKDFGGVGSFLLNPRYVENGKIYTGEAAGFQDLLWGFGMRYAMISGYCAAKSIEDNIDYKKQINKRISPRLKTSIFNRYVTDKGGEYVFEYVFNKAKKNPKEKWIKMLYERFNPSLYSRILFPFAKRYLTKRFSKLEKDT